VEGILKEIQSRQKNIMEGNAKNNEIELELKTLKETIAKGTTEMKK